MAILFLTQGISANMELCEQLEKISTFVSHYQIHKEYGGDSFYEYVVEELFSDQGDNDAHHNGSHEDNVPLHSQHQCCHSPVFIATSNGIALKKLDFRVNKQYSQYSFQYNSRFLESLFQPPRA
jgi:hypothetical protein